MRYRNRFWKPYLLCSALALAIFSSCGVEGGFSLVSGSTPPKSTGGNPNDNKCSCPATFTADTSGLYCKKYNSSTAPGAFINVVTGGTNGAYGPNGGITFSFSDSSKYPLTQSGGAITDSTSTGITTSTLAPVFWRGRLNAVTIQPTGQQDNVTYAISFCLSVAETREYVFGIAADNGVALSLNGNRIFVSSLGGSDGNAFSYWWLGAIKLNAGSHSVNFETSNAGGPAGFGFEFYRNTLAEVKTASALSDLSILSRSSDYVSQTIFSEDGTTCASGSSYNACTSKCESITTASCL